MEREQVELRGKMKEIERMKKELKDKDKKNENLRKAIDELNQRMTKYEVDRFDNNEDGKMVKVQMDLIKKESSVEVKKLKDKLAMMESSRN